MNIIYVDSGNVTSDANIYRYYGGLFRELKQIANVYLFEGPPHLVPHMAIKSGADCVVFGLGYFAQGTAAAFQEIPGLSELEIPVVGMLHKPQTLLQEKLDFCKVNKIDLLLDSQSTYVRHGQIANCRSIRSWFTACPSVYYPRDVDKLYDFGFSGALHGSGKISGPTKNLRVRVSKVLENSPHRS